MAHLWFSIMYLQCSKKETFRPRTGPEFPPNVSNATFFHTSVLPSEFLIITEGFIQWCKNDLVHIDRKKLFCLFRGGKFLFLSTVLQGANVSFHDIPVADELICHNF